MPFCHLALTGPKPLPPDYPRTLKAIGDHLRKRRLDLGLTQGEVAKLMGVHLSTIGVWERSQRRAPFRYGAQITRFLGYVPLPSGWTLADRLRFYRWAYGLTQDQLGEALGVKRGPLTHLPGGSGVGLLHFGGSEDAPAHSRGLNGDSGRPKMPAGPSLRSW